VANETRPNIKAATAGGPLSTRLSLGLALALAVIAGVLAYTSLYGREQRLDQQWQPVEVIVAAKPIAKGEELTRENLAKDTVPRRFAKGSLVRLNSPEAEVVIGQRATVDFAAGDPILSNFLASSTGSVGGFSDIVSKKTRAISVRVSPESSVQNLVRPGDRVDVLVTFRDPSGRT
jgi:pilus assembly protein CpaB